MDMASLNTLIPDPLADSKQYKRFYCLDIPSLEDAELEDEFHYLRVHLWELPSVCWPRERVHLLKDEIVHRGNTRHTVRERIKPKLASEVKL